MADVGTCYYWSTQTFLFSSGQNYC
jgi:hypothetical protein